jgi:gas vesicle protein
MAQDNGGDSLAWFLLGVATGAVAALLLAPQSGSETRDYVRRKAEEGRDAFDRSRRDVVERGRDLYERGKGLADEAAKKFRRSEESPEEQPASEI